MSDRHDVIVLGAGNAGLEAATTLREAGRAVAIVESGAVGGLCPLRGCVPKKVLVAAAEALDAIERARSQGVSVGAASIDWPKLIARKREVIAGTSEALEKSLAELGIELVRGRARFVDRDAVEVDGRTLRAKEFVVATGSQPRALPISGFELTKISDDVLELAAVPESVLFIGAGGVALELSHVLARAGAKVTILEAAPRPLAMLDEDAVAKLVAATRKLGVEVHAGVKVRSIGRTGDRYTVNWDDRKSEAELIVNGAGRAPDLDGLELPAAGVELERGAIRVGLPLRSATNEAIWVAGDALAGTPQLSPVATYEGMLVARAMLGSVSPAEYGAIPGCVFTVPALATVGLTEAAAKSIPHRVAVNDLTSWRSGRTYAESVAWAKVLIGEDDRILGAHLVGHGAAETIHAFAFAMRHGVSATVLRETVYAYPTFHSDVRYLL